MRGLSTRVCLGVVAALMFDVSNAATLRCTSAAWSSHTSVRDPTTLAVDGDILWMGSLFGGVLEWDTRTGFGRIYTRTSHCLPDNEVLDIAVGTSGSLAGEVWIASVFGVGRRLSGAPVDSPWHLFNAGNSGLSDPLANAVGITVGGEVWVGTFSNAAFRFDGNYFDHFDPHDSGLRNSTVTSIKTAGDSVWFGTWGGVYVLENGAFKNFTVANTGSPADLCLAQSPLPPDQLGLTSGVVDVLNADEETKVVWMASLDDGRCLNSSTSRFDGERWLTFSPFNSDIASDVMTGAATAPDGREVIVSPFGSQFFDPRDGSFSLITFPDGSGLGATDVVRKGDELWFASAEHGLVRWSNGNLTASRPPGLGDNIVQDLLVIDLPSSGGARSAWVANRRGAQQWVDGQWLTYDQANSPITGQDIKALARGLDGSIWFGTAVNGISRLDGQTWTAFNTGNSGLTSNNISALAVDPASGAVWAAHAHERGAARFDGQSWVPYDVGPQFGTNDLLVDGAGRVWFAGPTEVVRFDGANAQVANAGLPGTNALALALGEGRIYVGTDSGAAVMNAGTPVSAWQPLSHVDPFNDNIQALGIDADGHLWAGVRDVGLAEFIDGSWTQYNTADGLTNNRVRVIRFGADGTVWAGTEKGISIFDPHLAEPPERQDINYGLSGGWFEPATSGQGFMIDIDPDEQFMFVTWFTFDTTSPQAGGEIPGAEQRWLTAEGHFSGHRAELVVYQTRDGVFDEPTPVRAIPVGSMVLEFASCTRGTAGYDLPGFGLSGEIPITKLLPDEICSGIISGEITVEEDSSLLAPVSSGATQVVDYGFVGGWFEPATAGQGFMLDLLPSNDFVFLAWLTFDSGPSESEGDIPGAEQRWLTAEGQFNGNRAELVVYQTRDGVFDSPPPAVTEPVGTLVLEFASCASGTVTYDLADFGLSGQIPISRLLGAGNCPLPETGHINLPYSGR